MTTKQSKTIKQLGSEHYTSDFYSLYEQGSQSSAKEMVPLVIELVKPASVIDIGCGTGAWLSTFWENGVEDVWGVDGGYVTEKLLRIPAERFIQANLGRPLRIDRKFDLVVSLETAEHLPSKCAKTFVNSLTKLGHVVLFSAAIPYQGGENHINEQWPEYWAALFSDEGYVVVDALRGKVWNNQAVEWWYAQNTLIFVAQDRLGEYPLLDKDYKAHLASTLSVVHPRLYLQRVEEAKFWNILFRRVKTILKTIMPFKIYNVLRNIKRLWT
jgi:SAM-dependent methyltransferase